ncbi:hypothetical protein WR25_09972 [Diploscapter pachys]|uniref:Uncharacterized protein n=1 Tax=Diploscapter pachys TaxID=2018661 RepID=A0A2A2KR43_9BILA|nr:hypothetical protein WR25_09972 [Diploscapter pachys]
MTSGEQPHQSTIFLSFSHLQPCFRIQFVIRKLPLIGGQGILDQIAMQHQPITASVDAQIRGEFSPVLNTSMALYPPQNCCGFPGQEYVVQFVSGKVGTALMESPQKHSCLYSRPANMSSFVAEIPASLVRIVFFELISEPRQSSAVGRVCKAANSQIH